MLFLARSDFSIAAGAVSLPPLLFSVLAAAFCAMFLHRSSFVRDLTPLPQVVRLAPNLPDPYHTLGLLHEAVGDLKKVRLGVQSPVLQFLCLPSFLLALQCACPPSSPWGLTHLCLRFSRYVSHCSRLHCVSLRRPLGAPSPLPSCCWHLF